MDTRTIVAENGEILGEVTGDRRARSGEIRALLRRSGAWEAADGNVTVYYLDYEDEGRDHPFLVAFTMGPGGAEGRCDPGDAPEAVRIALGCG
jgi:hypothetical protein